MFLLLAVAGAASEAAHRCSASGRVGALNVHRPEKKKRKKLMKDTLQLANMLRRFTKEKEEMRKKNMAAAAAGLQRPKVPGTNSALLAPQSKAAGAGECHMSDLSTDPAVLSLLGSANNDLLQDMMGDLDFGMLDSPQPSSPAQGENGSFGHKGRGAQGGVVAPPPLPGGLPGPLSKRIEDLRAVRESTSGPTCWSCSSHVNVCRSLQASRLFDEEGRKKFFTLDMNNILLE